MHQAKALRTVLSINAIVTRFFSSTMMDEHVLSGELKNAAAGDKRDVVWSFVNSQFYSRVLANVKIYFNLQEKWTHYIM